MVLSIYHIILLCYKIWRSPRNSATDHCKLITVPQWAPPYQPFLEGSSLSAKAKIQSEPLTWSLIGCLFVTNQMLERRRWCYLMSVSTLRCWPRGPRAMPTPKYCFRFETLFRSSVTALQSCQSWSETTTLLWNIERTPHCPFVSCAQFVTIAMFVTSTIHALLFRQPDNKVSVDAAKKRGIWGLHDLPIFWFANLLATSSNPQQFTFKRLTHFPMIYWESQAIWRPQLQR